MTDSLKERLTDWREQAHFWEGRAKEALARIEELEATDWHEVYRKTAEKNKRLVAERDEAYEAIIHHYERTSYLEKNSQSQAATIAKLEGERDGWKAKCEKMWNEQDKPFTDLLHANLKLATLQGKLDRALIVLKGYARYDGYIGENARSILSDLQQESEVMPDKTERHDSRSVPGNTTQPSEDSAKPLAADKCPCGERAFAFNFEPGDGEITCAWCGRNMN